MLYANYWVGKGEVSAMLETCSRAIALTAMVAGLSMTAQAELLALRCEGTKNSIEIKEPDELKKRSPSTGEEDKGKEDVRRQARASTDVIVTDRTVYAFGAEFETGATNEAFVRFLRTDNNPAITGFVLEGFFGTINGIAGSLEAEQLKYKKNVWLYLIINYSLNCTKLERKF